MVGPRALIIETSHQPGLVALAEADRLLAERRLDQARRHARDLAPAVAELLRQQDWKPRDIEVVIVGRGPGSYTGLRVGIMSAKTFAYATGCRLLAVDTFAAIARQAPPPAMVVDVIADAQQDKVYVQRYRREGMAWIAATELAIVHVDESVARLTSEVWVSGPGLEKHRARMPAAVRVVDQAAWFPDAASVLGLGLERWRRGEADEPFKVEPLYLRPSSAEEKWDSRTT